MLMVLPSFVVSFKPEPEQTWDWRVNTEEALDVFCQILRLNGVTDYSVMQEKR